MKLQQKRGKKDKRMAIDLIEFQDQQYFSPFKPFLKSEAALLALWQEHYRQLNIQTTVMYGGRYKNGKAATLWVNYAQDQFVWSRPIE